MNFEEVATGVLKVLNNLAILDITLLQSMLVSIFIGSWLLCQHIKIAKHFNYFFLIVTGKVRFENGILPLDEFSTFPLYKQMENN